MMDGEDRPDRVGKIAFTFWVPKPLHKEVKRLSVELEISMKEIATTALLNEIERLSRPNSNPG